MAVQQGFGGGGSPLPSPTDAGSASQSAQPMPFIDRLQRDRLAIIVVLAACATIFYISWPLVNSGSAEAVSKVFGSVITLAGTWVSTILIFYFSRENFQAANLSVAALTNAVKDSTATKSLVASSNLSSAMTSVDKVKTLSLSKAGQEASIPLNDICNVFRNNPEVTRLPVLLAGVTQYIVHDVTLYRFISDRAIQKPPVILTLETSSGAAGTGGALTPATNPSGTVVDGGAAKQPSVTMLAEMLTHSFVDGPNKGLTILQVMSRFVVLKLTDTVDEAQRRLLSLSGASDVIVTDTGLATEPMRGLLTNTEIAKIVQG